MKIYESSEDYLEAIFALHQHQSLVRSIDIAHKLGVSKPSVSVAMKNLREYGYLIVKEGGNLVLTEKGKAIAEEMFERHTFIAHWLMDIGVAQDVALQDACRVEHAISKESFTAIKKYVNEH